MTAIMPGRAGPPTNDKARGANAGQVGDHNSKHPNSTPFAQDDQPEVVRVQRLQRRYEREGWALHALTGDEFVACRWGLHRVLHGLRECELFLRQVAGSAA